MNFVIPRAQEKITAHMNDKMTQLWESQQTENGQKLQTELSLIKEEVTRSVSKITELVKRDTEKAQQESINANE